jgi:hypothetical protein
LPLDRVKTLEDRIDRTALKLADDMKRVARKVYSRKLFSEPVPMKERVSEWQLMSEMGEDGIQAAVSMFRSQGLSPESALKEITRLEKEAANGKASNTNPPSVDDPSSGLGAIYP